jgi:hypothetical protein
VSGEFAEITLTQSHKDIRIHVDADTYNSLKKTSYKLPHSLDLVDTGLPFSLSISPVGLPRDHTFSLEMYGYLGLSLADVRWYMHTDATRGCDMRYDWDSKMMHTLRATEISQSQVGQIERAEYRVEYDSTLPRICIIA